MFNAKRFIKLSDGRISRITIIDTAGQERFRAINCSLFKTVDSFILLYDKTRKSSFESCIYYFIPNLRELCKSNIKGILIGNKFDLKDEEVVFEDEGRDLANSNNLLFSEISCKDNYNIFESFEKLIEITDKDNISKYEENIVLKKRKVKKKKLLLN